MVNGIINVYKEEGYTSFDVVAVLRGIYGQKKIGHTGTLDPDAKGVLPVCLGKATRVCDLLTDKDKEYEAVLLLGLDTDTQDITGNILTQKEVSVTETQVRQAVAAFVGAYDQIPPMYSALKVNGKKLCDLARKGITVERKPRRVHLYGIDILEIHLPEVRLLVRCSKGTYIRTLCKDIGDYLGCCGCMKSLVRTRVSDFTIGEAHTLSEIGAAPEKWILPIDCVFQKYASVRVLAQGDMLAKNGNRIPVRLVADMCDACRQDEVRLYDSMGNFVGLYAYQTDTEDFKPIKIFME